MYKLTIDDLIHLLDSRSDYDDVVCFARDLEIPELGPHAESPHEPGRVSLGFAVGNCMRTLRVEEKLGIVIVSSELGNPPLGNWSRVSGLTYTFRCMLDRAAQATFGEPREMIERVWLGLASLPQPIAMLRKVDGKLQRNLVMKLSIEGGKAEWIGYQGPLCGWVKQHLWADVPSDRNAEPRTASCDECKEADPECADCGHPPTSEPESPKKMSGIPPLCAAGKQDGVERRYTAMTKEEFSELRSIARCALMRTSGRTDQIELVEIWGRRLSRALDVIERVTGERDAYVKDGLVKAQAIREADAAAWKAGIEAAFAFLRANKYHRLAHEMRERLLRFWKPREGK